MGRVVEEGSVPVPQRQFGTDQAFSGVTSTIEAVSSGVGGEAIGSVMAALPEVPVVVRRFLSGMMGQEATEWPLTPQ